MSINTPPDLTKKQKFESIDIMRGIAILMVILVHTSQKIEGKILLRSFANYGQMGVQMFFVASAFTLCYSCEVIRSRERSLINFYIRRFFRIAPGYYVGILIYFLINVLCNAMNITSAWKNNDNLIDILINILFLNGLFPSANNNVVPGGWSIGTEMLFYLIFPLILIVYRSLRNIKYSYLIIPVSTLTFSMLMQYTLLIITNNSGYFRNNGFIYFSILNQLPVFCIGMSLYFAFKNGLLHNIKIGTSFVIFIILSCLSSFLMIRGTTLFTFVYVITPFISALSFVFLFILLQNSKVKNKFLEKIGILSYSGYLLHIIFAYFLTSFLSKKMSFVQPDIATVLLYSITVILTFFTANLLHKYVELKGIILGKRLIAMINQRKHATPNKMGS
jgi:peptidoglycan/LPS O-acetylase OafA/YrhL